MATIEKDFTPDLSIVKKEKKEMDDTDGLLLTCDEITHSTPVTEDLKQDFTLDPRDDLHIDKKIKIEINQTVLSSQLSCDSDSSSSSSCVSIETPEKVIKQEENPSPDLKKPFSLAAGLLTTSKDSDTGLSLVKLLKEELDIASNNDVQDKKPERTEQCNAIKIEPDDQEMDTSDADISESKPPEDTDGMSPYHYALHEKHVQLPFETQSNEQTDSAEEFRCTFCSKRFRLKRYLKAHLHTHSTEEFQCTICSKIFGLKRYLKAHLRTHSTEEFQCTICSKTFRLKRYLKAHLHKHSCTEEFQCTICSKTFGLQKYLKAHLRKHSTKGISMDHLF